MDILFLGGDRRMAVAYDVLKEKYKVDSLGLFDNDNGDIAAADAVLLPVPATRDGKSVNCPLTKKDIPLDIVKQTKRGTHIITCGYDFCRYPQTDYSAIDEFCIKNAISTAEGAIAYAVNNTDFTLYGSKILIIGFGRVGKVLLSRLSGFGADITVSARKGRDFAYLQALGNKYIETAAVTKAAKNFDIIFNTVDICLFNNKKELGGAKLFDLSTKGCVSFGEELCRNYVKLPGIPGKTAAQSAGIIIAETVDRIMQKR